MTSSVGLIKKSLYQKVTSKFAKIVGKIISKQDQAYAERNAVTFNRHVLTLNELTKKYNILNKELFNQVSSGL